MSEVPTSPTTRPHRSMTASVSWVLAGAFSAAIAISFVLESPTSASPFMSQELWLDAVSWCGGSTVRGAELTADLPFVGLLLRVVVLAAATWLIAAFAIKLKSGRGFVQSLAETGIAWRWWCLLVLPLLLDIFFLTLGAPISVLVLRYVAVLSLAGWLCQLFVTWERGHNQQGLGSLGLNGRSSETSGLPSQSQSSPGYPAATRQGWPLATLVVAMLIYVIGFTAMNWQLYHGLLLPHGDSAMYEEHLWNLLHGKGFRSYLDQGLFLGEHIQVIHVALVPVYLAWPSHLTLELCESVALAAGALPVFWMARRHTGSAWCGVALGVAYLCYFPMQFLDIAIDLKTFRPMSLGVPVLLFALDQLERGRYGTMWLLFAVTLSAKEDFAIVFGPLGVWLALYHNRSRSQPSLAEAATDTPGSASRVQFNSAGRPFVAWTGWLLAAGSVAYVIVLMKFVLPWFRDGHEIHYVSYFSEFGNSAGEIITNMLLNPGMLFSRLIGAHSMWYALAILAPVGFVALASPGRVAVCLPLFGLLCLNQLTRDQPTPWHHFHAPLVPIVFWAAAAGCGRLVHGNIRWQFSATTIALWVCLCSIGTGFVFGTSPMSRRFWDDGSSFHWAKLYVPGERARAFAEIEAQIPIDARVASTDFVHPRFTHHERSYDYSKYKRVVNDGKPGCPADTDYLVIDTSHKYSDFKSVADIPEYQADPDGWEVVPNNSNGLFIVLKRVSPKREFQVEQPVGRQNDGAAN